MAARGRFREFARGVNRALNSYGIDLRTTAAALRGTPTFLRNRRTFRRLAAQHGHRDFVWAAPFPAPGDRYVESGSASGHYFHQDLLVAQQIRMASPARHVDVGSRVDGLIAHVAAFRDVEVFDIRPLNTSARGIEFRQLDLSSLPAEYVEYTDSLSCLHTLEHFGLGRYGDTLDYRGYLAGWDSLWRLLKPGGSFYFSVPMGQVQRIEFDAHRVFSLPYLLELIDERYDVKMFSYVDDAGEVHIDVPADSVGASETFGLRMGCGIFTLQKR